MPGKEAISCQLSAGVSWFSTNHTQTPYNPRQRHVKLTADRRQLTNSPIDQRLRVERAPGEPEVVAMDDWRWGFACHLAFQRLAKDVPGCASLVVDEIPVFKAKRQRLAV